MSGYLRIRGMITDNSEKKAWSTEWRKMRKITGGVNEGDVWRVRRTGCRIGTTVWTRCNTGRSKNWRVRWAGHFERISEDKVPKKRFSRATRRDYDEKEAKKKMVGRPWGELQENGWRLDNVNVEDWRKMEKSGSTLSRTVRTDDDRKQASEHTHTHTPYTLKATIISMRQTNMT